MSRADAPFQVAALHTGTPAEFVDDDGRVWISSIARTRRTERLHIGSEGFLGDLPADLHSHGGPDRAACVYPVAHLQHWSTEFGRPDIGAGSFGENLTVAGADEDAVAIGDVWSLGTATVQISQPRAPCWKLERRLKIAGFARDVRDSGRTGWYVRVLQPGTIGPGDLVDVVSRPSPHLTISAVNGARWKRPDDELLSDLASCQALSSEWRAHFARRLAKPSSLRLFTRSDSGA